ncbi:alpha-amylase family protein [Nocardioides sp. KIGAM211]|uniref:Alpha-amylase family protein n=1 Tax=Nocardioides luti TaxID=2761101 RepID=A0A7X0RGY6_9ACTN|nr:alpha-amylase family protein [Nocardioides luti]MBB6626843.1 alpha-amylase family protein [Nocardioides luti]
MATPDDVHAAAAAVLAGLGDDRREAFALRLDRWWDDLLDGLAGVYPHPERVARSLVTLAATAYADRPADLHRLDQRRLLAPDWLQQPGMFGYACYTERFGDDLAGLGERLDYLEELGVTYLHLMPLLQPREGDNDGGYAVQDYRSVRPDLGTMDDLRDLATTLRGRGISLVVDLVLNHVAREHEWAVKARAGDPAYRDYFHVHEDRTLPDAFEQTLPEVFPDFAPGSFTFDEELGAWVWTTFNSWQWDLNWGNPEVLLEFADIILALANVGVEVLRLDAIAFLWKRLGTSCQNQPEVHAITQVLRSVARLAAPALVFKAEAIVGPRDLVQYLGTGHHAGRVSDLAYHNSLMVQVWSMLATRDTVLARHALASLPAAPSTGTWIAYVRCHDDIGWAIDDGDAAAVGLNGHDHRRFLADWYAGEFPGSWADGLVFQANPETGDRRISGTAAALVGLDTDRTGGLARLFLAHAIVAGWGGVPVVWSGDELGQPNDPDWADEPGHGDDNRWAHRPRLDEARAAERHDLRTVPGKVFTGLAHLARVRAGLPQLHASAPSRVLLDTDPGVLATVRAHASGPMVGLYNVTGEPRPFPLHRLAEAGLTAPHDALGGHPVTAGSDGVVWLPAYAAWWVVDAPG